MLIKMRESKGFTLVELMIVVAIIGILAAVAVPYYQRYVAKSRLTSLVFPGVHAIENAISTRYAVAGSMPNPTSVTEFLGDADTTYFGTPTWTRGGANTATLAFTVKTDTADKKFAALENKNTFRAVAEGSGGKLYWKYDGTLAKEFGL